MAGIDGDPHESERRAARNQSLFREVNEKIQRVSRDETATFHLFSCECADLQCIERIPLTAEEYEHIRRIPTHFFVKPGHVVADAERVVETDGDSTRYEVVEKFGEAGKVAVELAPR